MKHKLMQVMMERDHHKKHAGRFIELDDAYLGGQRMYDRINVAVLR